MKALPTAHTKNLSTVSILPQNKSEVKEKCNICNKEVLIKDLRNHVFMCKTKGVLSSESDDDVLIVPAFSPRRMPDDIISAPPFNENTGKYFSTRKSTPQCR